MKFQSGWYMASSGSIDPKYNNTLGVIQNTGNINKGFYTSRLDAGVPVCLDNQAFTGKFNLSEWLSAIDKIKKYKDQCLFVVIPDVFGDCVSTLYNFSKLRELVVDLPVALVSQDGISKKIIPWDDFDCLFVGGTDNHKLREEGGKLIEEAKERGKWVHIGRVNSISRIIKFWQADSWDGTHLNYDPSYAVKFHEAVLQVRAMKASGRFDFNIKDKGYLDFTDWVGLAYPELSEEDDVGYWDARLEYVELYGKYNL